MGITMSDDHEARAAAALSPYIDTVNYGAERERLERKVAELEGAVETLRTALIQSNLITNTPQEQGRIAQDALNATWHVTKGKENDA
jgi:hypothetical protein